MKKTIINLSILMLVAMSALAQETQVENAKKALKEGKVENAQQIIEKLNIEKSDYCKIEPEVVSDYLYVKANTYRELGEKKDDAYNKSIDAYTDLIEFETGMYYIAKNIETKKVEYFCSKEELDQAIASKKYKKAKSKNIKKYHTDDAKPEVGALATKIHTEAIDAYNAKDYKKSREYFVSAYYAYSNPAVGRADTVLLFNAASVGINEKNYPAALKIYEELLEMNYTGIQTVYEATSVATGEKTNFASKKDMDMQVKFGVVKNDTIYTTENNQPSIYRSIGSIYLSFADSLDVADSIKKKEYYDKAKAVIKKGKDKYPADYDLLITLGNIYLKEGNKQGFLDVMQESIDKDPTNEALYYNIGATNADLGMNEEAKKAYLKAIELKPDYTDAYISLAVVILTREKEINDEISDMPIRLNKAKRAKLANLKKEKTGVYKEAIIYLEKAYEHDKSNEGLLQTMKNIYYALDRNDDFMKIKKELDALPKQ